MTTQRDAISVPEEVFDLVPNDSKCLESWFLGRRPLPEGIHMGIGPEKASAVSMLAAPQIQQVWFSSKAKRQYQVFIRASGTVESDSISPADPTGDMAGKTFVEWYASPKMLGRELVESE